MDGRLKSKIRSLSMELAFEEQARLRAAGTMVDLEELACEIGDEITVQMVSIEMSRRADEAAEATNCECPDCGHCCGQGDPKSRRLTGLRGEVSYREPTYHCPACRRSFFPGSRQRGLDRPRDDDPQVVAEGDLGGSQSKQL
jgi:hypothetical protein